MKTSVKWRNKNYIDFSSIVLLRQLDVSALIYTLLAKPAIDVVRVELKIRDGICSESVSFVSIDLHVEKRLSVSNHKGLIVALVTEFAFLTKTASSLEKVHTGLRILTSLHMALNNILYMQKYSLISFINIFCVNSIT